MPYWVLSSILMFVSSIVFYLFVKVVQVNGVDKRIYTLANTLVPSVIFFLISYFQHISLTLSIGTLAFIFVLRVAFNYVGTIFGYKGMEQAPNAGYSLVIQKSYAIYTLFASIILYKSEVSIPKIILSIIIVFFAIGISIDRSKKTSIHSYEWVMYSLIAFFCFGTISLSSKYFAALGVASVSQLFWTNIFTSGLTGIDTMRIKKRISFVFTKKIFLYLLMLGISVTSFYYFKLQAEIAAPNLGYVGALNAGSNAFYTVIVALLFKDALSKKKLAAVIGLTVCLILLLFVR